jgi:hypothetical protein
MRCTSGVPSVRMAVPDGGGGGVEAGGIRGYGMPVRRLYATLALGAVAVVAVAASLILRGGGAGAAAAVSPVGERLGAEQFVRLERPPWKAERQRWCSLIDLATNPERAGKRITVSLEMVAGKGVASRVWHFYTDDGRRALSSEATACFSQIHLGRREGSVWFDFVEETDPVAHDPAVDAASSADAAFSACAAQYPEVHEAPVTVATVVDSDGTVWTSDGTRESATLRACLGEAHNAWVKAQIDAHQLTLLAPAVVVGAMPGNKAAAPAPASTP